MFGKKKNAAQKRIDSLIGAGTLVEGDVTFTGGPRIDGRVKGDVTSAGGESGTLVVGEHARVDGGVRVSHVVVNGQVNGPITATDYLELQPKARVAGDVSYKTLEMHVGAVVQGRLNHAEPGTASVVELARGRGGASAASHGQNPLPDRVATGVKEPR